MFFLLILLAGSMENLGSLIRSLDKSHNSDSIFLIKSDSQTKESFKLVLIKLLNQITTAVQNEEAFCAEFFKIKPAANQQQQQLNKADDSQSIHPMSHQLSRSTSFSSIGSSMSTATAGATVAPPSSSSSLATRLKNVSRILDDIFGNTIDEQIKSVIESIVKSENILVIFIYSDLLNRVLVSHNNKQYVHRPLVSLLRVAKEKCDEYVNQIKESIGEFRVNKREKIGILKYVLYFEEFVKEAESCWEPIRDHMYEKLCIIYQVIVSEIFKGIESVANESQKTPADVVRFQNYQHMNHVMRSINGLKESTKYSREQYLTWKQNYVKEFFGRPLEKLHSFFEKVDAKIERGIKHEDISYQLELSANNLREIIKEYPAKEVRICTHTTRKHTQNM